MEKKTTTLHTDKKSTLFNVDMLVGLAVGAMLGPVTFGFLGGAITMVAAAAIGSIKGYDRMTKERRNGKEIPEPTIMNKKALAGGMLTSLALTAAAAISTAAVLTVPLQVGAILLGGLVGGLVGKHEQAVEKAEALRQQKVVTPSSFKEQQLAVALGVSQEVVQEPSKFVETEMKRRTASQQPGLTAPAQHSM